MSSEMKLREKHCRFGKGIPIMQNMQHINIQCVETRTVPDVELPTGSEVPKNQSKIVQPSKEDLLKKHQTRLKHRNV